MAKSAVKTQEAGPKLDLRNDRLNALLDAAAAEFNLYGVAGASLSRITRSVGLTRAALYYYVDSREDLAFRCYRRACRVMADDLAAAKRAGADGLARVRGFIERTLDPARPAGVVLTDVACLDEARRVEIEAIHGRNAADLERFIRDGIRDGSVRECDAEVAAQAILGMVFWAPLAGEWTPGAGEDVRRHAAHSIAELVSDGVAADPDAPVECPLEVAALAFRPGNAFDREAAAAIKVDLLTRAASRLFNRRGIDGTSLDEVTQELGATKGAFYQYFRDKDTLVVECHKRSQRLSVAIADAAEKLGRNGKERGLIGLHLLTQAYASDLAPLAPLTGLEALPAKARGPILKRAMDLQQRYERFSRDGVADRSYRPFEVRTLSTTGAGVFSWIPRWRRDDDPRPARAIADEMVALFARGLRSRP
ncbi:MAG: TetR family transcriptional regulator [Gammaproteobacteria bacterium]